MTPFKLRVLVQPKFQSEWFLTDGSGDIGYSTSLQWNIAHITAPHLTVYNWLTLPDMRVK